MKILRCTSLILTTIVPLLGQGRNYGRSMVITQQGIAATSQTLASSAAAQILAKGGSAVDAAIAANAVLAVVEPMKTGIGGDLFVMYWEAEHRQARRAECLGRRAQKPSHRSSSPSRVSSRCRPPGFTPSPCPGAVEGWAKIHQRYGKLPWKDLFQSAIAYAEQGFPVTEAIQESWAANADRLKAASRIRARVPAGRQASPKSATCSGIPISGVHCASSPIKVRRRITRARSPPRF